MMLPGELLIELSTLIVQLLPMLKKLVTRKLPTAEEVGQVGQTAAKVVIDVFKNFEQEFEQTFKDEFAMEECRTVLRGRDGLLEADFNRFDGTLNDDEATLLRRLIFTAYKIKGAEGGADVMQNIAIHHTDAAMKARFDQMRLKMAPIKEQDLKKALLQLGGLFTKAWSAGILPAGKFIFDQVAARAADFDNTLAEVSNALTRERTAGDPNSSFLARAKRFAKGEKF